MRKPPNGKVRINVDLTIKGKELLEDLQIRSEASSLIEVIRRAIALYDLVITHKTRGSQIVLVDPEGKQTEIIIL